MAKSISDKSLRELLYPDGRQKDIYRKLSYPFVKLLLPTGISADMIQLIRLIFCIAGTAMFFLHSYWLMILGAIFFQLNILFDTFDGAIARYQGKASVKGEYQDVALDHLTSSVLYFISAAGIAYFYTVEQKYLLLGLLTIALAQVAAFLRAMYIEYSIPVAESQKSNLLIYLAHQDNSRLFALMLLIASIVGVFTNPLWLAWIFLIFVSAKILILSVHILSKTGKNPFSVRILVRYFILVLSIFLWLMQKILGANTKKTRVNLSSGKQSKIEKTILSRLN